MLQGETGCLVVLQGETGCQVVLQGELNIKSSAARREEVTSLQPYTIPKEL